MMRLVLSSHSILPSQRYEGPMAQVVSFGLRIQCSDTRRISTERLKVAKTRPNTAIPTGKLGVLLFGFRENAGKVNGLLKRKMILGLDESSPLLLLTVEWRLLLCPSYMKQ